MNIDDLIGHTFMYWQPGNDPWEKVYIFTDVLLVYKTGEEILGPNRCYNHSNLDRGVTYFQVLRTRAGGGPTHLAWSPVNSYCNFCYWEMVT